MADQMKIEGPLFEEAVVTLNRVVTNEVQTVFDELAKQVTSQDDTNELLRQVIDESISFQNKYNDSYAPQYSGALELLKEFGEVAEVLAKRNVTTAQGSAESINVEKMGQRSRLN